MTDRRLAVEAWESLFRAQHEVFEEISADFEGTELSQGEYDVLLTVMRSPDTTARLRTVTANMLISQPSVSRLVERMVARGLLTKCPDPDDGLIALGCCRHPDAAALRRVSGGVGQQVGQDLLQAGRVGQQTHG